MKTRRGFPVSTDQVDAVTAFDRFADRLARIEPGAEAILEETARMPLALVLRIGSAMACLFGQTGDAQAEAQRQLAAAQPMQASATSWERSWLECLRFWHAKDFDAAASRFEKHTDQWPADLPALKCAEFLYYILGQHYSGPRFRAHVERLTSVLGDDPDYLAARSFAHELCGDTATARQHAEKALEIRPNTPWAHHSLAHVLIWEGNPDEAAERMDGWLPLWRTAARPIHSHNAWHTALLHLDRLEPGRAWEILESDLWCNPPGMIQEQIDIISLLWRMELAGIEVEEAKWKGLVPHLVPHIETLFMPFISLHHVYALGRAGESGAVVTLMATVRERAAQPDREAHRVWQAVGQTAMEGAAALAQRDYSLAADRWREAMPRITQVGGSDAQDDLFRFSYFESVRQAGQQDEAREYLTNRLNQKKPSRLEQRLREELAA